MQSYDVVIIGGGIAGISALEQIYLQHPDCRILLLSAGSYVKVAITRLKLTRNLEELEVHEKPSQEFSQKYQNLTIVSATLHNIYPVSHYVVDSSGIKYAYKKLCICSGAKPKLIEFGNPHVLGLRDTESAAELKNRLSTAKKICIVGNGGIATELVHELKHIDVVWIIRQKYISSTFIDAAAAGFLLESMADSTGEETNKPATSLRYTVSSSDTKNEVAGCALGPNWHNSFNLSGTVGNQAKNISIEYESEIKSITDEKPKEMLHSETECWPVYVTMQSGKIIGCDFIVSATGVSPTVPVLMEQLEFQLGADGGILVDDTMETSVKDIFAAGDVCCVNWSVAFHWFQMRLWSQARPMGFYAGYCIAASLLNEPKPLLDFSFELFTHVTRFFGFKVVLLGLFNGQKLDGDYEAFVRVTKGVEYLKLVVRDGKVHGAVLIGDTEMEETLENLILDQLDISQFGENLLSPDIDIDDYFD